MKKVCLVLLLMSLSGCADMPCKKSTLIEVGEPGQIKDCKLLKTFTGPASDRMWGTPYIGNFKNEAMEKAEKMGATHVLWRAESEGIESVPELRAYKCKPNPDAYGYYD